MDIDPKLIPKERRDRLVRATWDVMTRIRTQDPALWARIERRAAEIKAERERAQA